MAAHLVTGAAGFIGFHLSRALLERGDAVVGVDDLNAYYDPALKADRLALLEAMDGFTFRKMDLSSERPVERLFGENRFDTVVHLAAQAGVRYSLSEPRVYVRANVAGTLNVLEGCRHAGVGHLVFASSSSVYGMNEKLPYAETDPVDHPVSLYAATKKSCEMLAHSYAHLYGVPCTGVRFFTVYGPWGRPDMAYYKFAARMVEGRPIDVYGGGSPGRDMTYVDDCVEGLMRLMAVVPAPDPTFDAAAPAPPVSSAPYRIYNLGNSTPVGVDDLVSMLERILGVEAVRRDLPMQPGDVQRTMADTSALERATGFRPHTPVEEGLARFVEWFEDYHGRT
jgi:UDP-glucuronate 4-epimerase